MGQYQRIKCPTCGINIEVTKVEEIPKRCPACKENIYDAVISQGGGTGLEGRGLTTANTHFK